MEKQRWEESGRRRKEVRRKEVRRKEVRRKEVRRSEKRKGEKQEDAGARFTVFFPCFGAPEGRKVTSLKRRVRSQLARWEMKNCTPFWREAHFQVRSVKNWRSQTTFGSWDVEKVHAVVARSTFPSQKCKKLTVSDHFWKLRWRKSAHRCGAKHISKPKVSKTDGLRPLLEVAMSKKCTPLWREAHFQVKSVQNWRSQTQTTFGSCGRKRCTPLWREAHFQVKSFKNWQSHTTFGSCDVEKVHTVVAQSTFASQNAQSRPFSDHSWKLRCRKSARHCGAKHVSKSKA